MSYSDILSYQSIIGPSVDRNTSQSNMNPSTSIRYFNFESSELINEVTHPFYLNISGISFSIRKFLAEYIQMLPLYEKYEGRPDVYIKTKVTRFGENPHREVVNFSLNEIVPIPELYESQTMRVRVEIFTCNSTPTSHATHVKERDTRDYSLDIMVMEHCGPTLSEKFGVIGHGPGCMSTEYLTSEDLREIFFPQDSVPSEILEQIRIIFIKLHREGYHYDDIHGGNLTIKDGRVMLIDLESIFPLEKAQEEIHSSSPFTRQENSLRVTMRDGLIQKPHSLSSLIASPFSLGSEITDTDSKTTSLVCDIDLQDVTSDTHLHPRCSL